MRSTTPHQRQRHRERRERTRARILQAASELLEDRTWAEISLEDVMRRAQLTRTAFYRYFPDQQMLLLALLEDLGLRLDLVADTWERGEGDAHELVALALRDLTDVFHRHGRLLRALADASTHDPAVAAIYADLGARFSASAAARIAIEVRDGRSHVRDPQEVAAALVWMNERYLLDRFGRPPLGDPDRAAGALTEVWLRTVYGADPS
jgi:TetR/AcrR family transcriptional regulator, ethionamide resistance regulator